ncbi:ATP-dependent DNA helicase PIF1-like protein [Tanacetum coccineum]
MSPRNPPPQNMTGKTFLYKTIISRQRSERNIVLAFASSGIASLLLPGGRTAHSRFLIPLELLENNTCGIKQNTHLAELMQILLVIPKVKRADIVQASFRIVETLQGFHAYTKQQGQ